jgi:uridine kinase
VTASQPSGNNSTARLNHANVAACLVDQLEDAEQPPLERSAHADQRPTPDQSDRPRLLDPFLAGAGASYRLALFDEPTDSPVDTLPATVGPGDVSIFGGIFLQRPELTTYWDLVVFLDGQQRVDLERLGLVLADLPSDPIEVVAHTLTWSKRIDRYSSGMRHYLDLVNPEASVDLVIDNNEISAPFIVKNR